MTTLFVERMKEVEGEWVLFPEPEDLDTENDFSIDPDNLDTELCRMARLMIRYGEIQAELKTQLSRKEENVKLTFAVISQNIRAHADTSGQKITESTVKEKAQVHEQYQLSLADLHNTQKYSIMADNFWRTIQKKADLLQALTYRQSSEIKRGAW